MKLKYIYSTIVMLFICAVSFAQSTAINYQAIARNSSGDPLLINRLMFNSQLNLAAHQVPHPMLRHTL